MVSAPGSAIRGRTWIPLGRTWIPLGRTWIPLGRTRIPLGRIRIPLGQTRPEQAELSRRNIGLCPRQCQTNCPSDVTFVT
jgi:hypothetical protein